MKPAPPAPLQMGHVSPVAVPAHLPEFDGSTVRTAPAVDRICANCHWWHPWTKQPEGKQLGDCRARPPVLFAHPLTGKPQNRYASTPATFDCGQWRCRRKEEPRLNE